jgi:hypothetical protein
MRGHEEPRTPGAFCSPQAEEDSVQLLLGIKNGDATLRLKKPFSF